MSAARRKGIPTKPETVAAGTEFSDPGPDPFAAEPEAEDVEPEPFAPEPDTDDDALSIIHDLERDMLKRADEAVERTARHPRWHERFAGQKTAETWREAAAMVRALVEGDDQPAG